MRLLPIDGIRWDLMRILTAWAGPGWDRTVLVPLGRLQGFKGKGIAAQLEGRYDCVVPTAPGLSAAHWFERTRHR